jgi:integrase
MEQAGEEYLFSPSGSHKGPVRATRLSVAGNVTYQVLQKAAGLEIEGLRLHDLRHTCASRALRYGATPHEVQRLLGHTSIAMTERYLHWDTGSEIWAAAMAGFK